MILDDLGTSVHLLYKSSIELHEAVECISEDSLNITAIRGRQESVKRLQPR